LDTHPHHHTEPHLESSDLLRDVVIGMSDGLTVPFALAAGLSAAVDSTSIIVIAGLSVIAAGSIAMGVGGYMAGKTEMDHYHEELKKETEEVDLVPEVERNEVRAFYANLGLSEEVQQQAVDQMTIDKEKWADFVMKYDLGLNKPDPQRAKKRAFNIGISYAVAGIIPISPYFFASDTITALKMSAVITLFCLFIFGYIKSNVTGLKPLEGAVRVTLIGAVAAACAFGIARMIGGE
jgi:vacuolar iron transporter family protein